MEEMWRPGSSVHAAVSPTDFKYYISKYSRHFIGTRYQGVMGSHFPISAFFQCYKMFLITKLLPTLEKFWFLALEWSHFILRVMALCETLNEMNEQSPPLLILWQCQLRACISAVPISFFADYTDMCSRWLKQPMPIMLPIMRGRLWADILSANILITLKITTDLFLVIDLK